jgi:phosphoglycolate phosphatase
MKKYQAVIFDLDGTLLNTLDDLADGVNHTLAEFNYPQRSKQDIRRFLGNGIERLAKLVLPPEVTEAKFREVYKAFKEYYTDHCQIKTRAYDGIEEVLKTLKADGYKLAIVSNKNAEAVAALNQIYFKDYVSVAIGQKAGIRKKPAPDTVLAAMEVLGVAKQDAIYVGDSEVDKATADNTGMDAILVTWGFRDKEELEQLKPTYLIDRPEEILSCLK